MKRGSSSDTRDNQSKSSMIPSRKLRRRLKEPDPGKKKVPSLSDRIDSDDAFFHI